MGLAMVKKESLLTKYQIPLNHLDFPYIEQCCDGKELEKIVQILRSQQEGYYPELTLSAEQRLSVIKPKSKLFHRQLTPILHRNQLDNVVRDEITFDLKTWLVNIAKNNSELLTATTTTKENITDETKSTTKIRTIAILNNEEQEQQLVINGNNDDDVNNNSQIKRSTDYAQWDKYDVDTELLKIDLEQEKLKKIYNNDNKQIINKYETTTINHNNKTETELLYEANYEKEKGNEFYKTYDYDAALQHYTNSINYKPSLASYNNRSITYIKLKQFHEALNDCQYVLETYDPNNIKALVRKSQAYEALGKHENALETIEYLIQIDPNNSLAQSLAQKYRCNTKVIMKKKRFAITDDDNNNNNNNENVIIPIPGPSTMKPPHYIRCNSDEVNPNEIQQEIYKINNKMQVINIVTIDENSDDDCCVVNHLNHLCSLKMNSKEQSEKINKTKSKLTIRGKEMESQIEIPIETTILGEPHLLVRNADDNFIIPHDIHSPYTFLKTWHSINRNDTNYRTHASILKMMDMNRIANVIRCNLDNNMFTTLIKCFIDHFMVPDQIDRIYLFLTNLVTLPRFGIVLMFTTSEDRELIQVLIDFLKQHGKYLPQQIEDIYLLTYL